MFGVLTLTPTPTIHKYLTSHLQTKQSHRTAPDGAGRFLVGPSSLSLLCYSSCKIYLLADLFRFHLGRISSKVSTVDFWYAIPEIFLHIFGLSLLLRAYWFSFHCLLFFVNFHSYRRGTRSLLPALARCYRRTVQRDAGWLRWSLTGELSLSCARPAADE